MNSTSSFQTDSINTASFFLVKNVPLLDVIQDRPKHCVFIFEGEDQCIKLYSQYMSGDAVSAKDLFTKKKELARMVNEVMRDNKTDNNQYGKFYK